MIEKVNAFYLQKEAEACTLIFLPHLITDLYAVLIALKDAARKEAHHPGSQRLDVEGLSRLRNPCRRVPAIRQRPEQASGTITSTSAGACSG